MKKFTHRFSGSLSDIESLPASGGLKIKVVFWTPFGPSNNPKILLELES